MSIKRDVCVKSIKVCPTGTLSFGPRDKILKAAQKRLGEVKKRFPEAGLMGDEEEVSWIYLLHQPEAEFQMTVRAKMAKPFSVARRAILRPFGALVAGTFRTLD